MSQIVKAYTGVFFLMLLVALGCGIISAQIQSSYAREYKQVVVTEIENSGFSNQVMQSCRQQAKKQGYELQLMVYQYGKEAELFEEGKVIHPKDIHMVEVLLHYRYSIPFLNYCSRNCIRGYAV